MSDAPAPPRELDDGHSCPWQDRKGRCTAREARPLGCRVFFCDPTFEKVAPELSEKFLNRLKDLADRHNWSWNYAPLHCHLRDAHARGDLTITPARKEHIGELSHRAGGGTSRDDSPPGGGSLEGPPVQAT
jgi:hypothetical protein